MATTIGLDPEKISFAEIPDLKNFAAFTKGSRSILLYDPAEKRKLEVWFTYKTQHEKICIWPRIFPYG